MKKKQIKDNNNKCKKKYIEINISKSRSAIFSLRLRDYF